MQQAESQGRVACCPPQRTSQSQHLIGNAHACADGQLHQEPAPELRSLRQGEASTVDRVEVQPEQGVAVAGTRCAAYDLSLRLYRGSAASSGTPWLVSISVSRK